MRATFSACSVALMNFVRLPEGYNHKFSFSPFFFGAVKTNWILNARRTLIIEAGNL
jgi:hypothetical protein